MGTPISRAFLEALADTFERHGRDCLKAVRETEPETYASICATAMPQKAADDISSDAQLDRLFEAITANLKKAIRNGVETFH
jgi:hypothetical protein